MRKIIISLIGMMMISLVVAQVSAPQFPSSFTMTLPQLPLQQSPNQLIFNCPYDQNIEHRITNVFFSIANQTHINVEADVQYWTQGKNCAGSQSFKIAIPIASVSTPTQLGNAFVNGVRTEFINEANSNRQEGSNRTIIGVGI